MVKSAEDAFFWGVHLSAPQRDAMDALIERLVLLRAECPARGDAGGGGCSDPEQLFALWRESDPAVRALQQALNFERAAKRYGFFLQYLRDALGVEAARALGQASKAPQPRLSTAGVPEESVRAGWGAEAGSSGAW